MPITALLLATLSIAQTPTPTPAPDAISGRPPANAVARTSPQVYEVTFIAGSFDRSSTMGDWRDQPRAIQVARLPVIARSTFSAVDMLSPRLSTWRAARGIVWSTAQQPGPDGFDSDRFRVQALRDVPVTTVAGAPLGMALAQFDTSDMVRWSMTWRVQVWSSQVNEQLAAAATWPQAWPDECVGALAPQRFVESDDPRFKQFVDRVSGGSLRTVPVWLAAKDLVRATVRAIQVTGNDTVRGPNSVLIGMNMRGAAAAMTDGRGTTHDLAAACVAVLRAAGIPARPVIGFPHGAANRLRPAFESWAEVFLPGSGWVAFDPKRMAAAGLGRDVRERWPWFGTIDDLNRRIPVSFSFTLDEACDPAQSPPAAWGVGRSPDPQNPQARDMRPQCVWSHIELRSSSRGAGSG